MAKPKMTEAQVKQAEERRNVLSLQARESLKVKDYDGFFVNELTDGPSFVVPLLKEVCESFEDVTEFVDYFNDKLLACHAIKDREGVKKAAILCEAGGRLKESDFNGSGRKGRDPSASPKWNELPSLFAFKRGDTTAVYANNGDKSVTLVEVNGSNVVEEKRYTSMSNAASDVTVFGEGCYKSDGWSIARSIEVVEVDGVSTYVTGEKIKFTVSFDDTQFDGSEIIEAFKLALQFKGKSPDSLGDVSSEVKSLFARMNDIMESNG